jgi:hypothetical protein
MLPVVIDAAGPGDIAHGQLQRLQAHLLQKPQRSQVFSFLEQLAVLVADASDPEAVTQVFRGMRVTFPVWSPTEDLPLSRNSFVRGTAQT